MASAEETSYLNEKESSSEGLGSESESPRRGKKHQYFGLESTLVEKLEYHVQKYIHNFLIQLTRREIRGAYDVAVATTNMFLVVVKAWRWTTARELMQLVHELGHITSAAQPLELTIGNTTRRVLFIVREAYVEKDQWLKMKQEKSEGRAPSLSASVGEESFARRLYKLFEESDEQDDYSKPYNVKDVVVTEITDLVTELAELYKSVADQAQEHIHANEVIMTFGKSRTVEEFLKAAASFRSFEVFVAESAPSCWGREQAVRLAQAGINTTLIPDSAIFAMMSRVNKVIIPTHSVMANGGLVALTGTHMLALAAKHHSVPVIVCAGLYKLCPLYPFDQDSFNELNTPNAILPFDEVESNVEVFNPSYDYVPPELVELFVTNTGGHAPSYIYRLLSHYYHLEDYHW